MRRIKTLIVDDERLARDRIRRLLAEEPDIDIVGECVNARQAADVARATPPDLLFVDVQMPKGDGFDLLEQLETRVPVVVFVTAYEQFALRAFDVHARDYLLKPFEEARFRASVQRAREALTRDANTEINTQLLNLLRINEKPRLPDLIMVRSAGKTSFVKPEDIDWIESADNYVRLHIGRESHIVRETMAAFEEKLRPAYFVRIHRSTIVNIHRVQEFRQWFHGDFLAILKDGQQLRMSRTYRDHVQDLLGQSL